MSFLWDRPTALIALAGLLTWLLWAVAPAAADDKDGTVQEGKPAPDVALPATQVGTVLPGRKDAKTLHLKDVQGKKNVVLYFFPKALTKG
jgi:hypothetical protein